MREKEKKGESEEDKPISGPSEDFQVIQAVKYLKAYPLIQNMVKK